MMEKLPLKLTLKTRTTRISIGGYGYIWPIIQRVLVPRLCFRSSGTSKSHSKTARWNCTNTPEHPEGTQLKDTSEQFVQLPNPVVKERTLLSPLYHH